MAEERIAIIIKEINYWKQHKLLPEMYCDYLLALYTKGTGQGEANTTEKGKIKMVLILQFILQLLLLPFSFLVTYFTEFHPIMQLGILSLFIVLSFWQYKSLKTEDNIICQLSFVIFLLLVFLTSVFAGEILIRSNQWLTTIIMLLNFLGWIVCSKKKGILYLNFIGIIGIIFTSFYIVL
ncbi:hypothetical protein [Virgibacillus oceani]|uniref:Uncharacterized protein n=1 Tax=Virgibacillus oceani TaxID=1479511 RepID=A0A917LXE0_9BACI|nr:hypothetical protein [Virgibacillus oceani]GGG63487.1 hypothetical protein GCM10011398_03640 [Virgibacillus oceani]